MVEPTSKRIHDFFFLDHPLDRMVECPLSARAQAVIEGRERGQALKDKKTIRRVVKKYERK